MPFPKGQQPRAAIPYQFYNLAGVTRRIGLINDSKWGEVEESIRVAEEHCKEMKPDWDKLGDEFSGSKTVLIGDVDCTVEKDLCSK